MSEYEPRTDWRDGFRAGKQHGFLNGWILGLIVGLLLGTAIGYGTAQARPVDWHSARASVFFAHNEPALGCWPWSVAKLKTRYVVAHKSLPCGTRVRFLYHGRKVDAIVRDRGPYANRAEWDLDIRLSRALGFPYGVDRVHTRVVN